MFFSEKILCIKANLKKKIKNYIKNIKMISKGYNNEKKPTLTAIAVYLSTGSTTFTIDIRSPLESASTSASFITPIYYK